MRLFVFVQSLLWLAAAEETPTTDFSSEARHHTSYEYDLWNIHLCKSNRGLDHQVRQQPFRRGTFPYPISTRDMHTRTTRLTSASTDRSTFSGHHRHDDTTIRAEPPGFDEEEEFYESFSEDDAGSEEASDNELDSHHGTFQSDDDSPLHSPVVYRYYARNRSRRASAGSIPFILLGPNVDHWKVTGQELAARGFSVMVVERVREDNPEEDSAQQRYQRGGHEEAINLVLELLEALRWQKVVLVACDTETALAIRAAMELSPDRIIGLVLCGNLDEAQDFVSDMHPNGRRVTGTFAVDRFLQHSLDCPFQIVWDGDIPSTSSSSSLGTGTDIDATEPPGGSRSLILGGGSAPHRRRPELLAWVLTRFVEEKIAPSMTRARGGDQESVSSHPARKFRLPFGDALAQESIVVWGRLIAAALFYGIMMKIALYQYDNVRGGIFNIKSMFAMLLSVRRKIVGAGPALIGKLVSIFSFDRLTDKEVDDQLESSESKEIVSVEGDDDSSLPSESSRSVEDDTEESQDEGNSVEEKGTEEDEDEVHEAPGHTEFKPFFFLDNVIA